MVLLARATKSPAAAALTRCRGGALLAILPVVVPTPSLATAIACGVIGAAGAFGVLLLVACFLFVMLTKWSALKVVGFASAPLPLPLLASLRGRDTPLLPSALLLLLLLLLLPCHPLLLVFGEGADRR